MQRHLIALCKTAKTLNGIAFDKGYIEIFDTVELLEATITYTGTDIRNYFRRRNPQSDLDQTKESMRKQALEEAKAEADRILDGFEGDMQKKNFEIERLTSELQKKEYEISWLRAKLDSMTDVPVLIAGDEDDFYPGEAKDFVLSAVKKELSATEVRTRRYDVLSDILNVNNYEAIGEQRAEEAKRLLSNYSGMTQKLKKGLEDIGFIFDQSDHQKVKYYGDDRYTIIYASTPSDKGHGGKK